jgi:hypothetical protein
LVFTSFAWRARSGGFIRGLTRLTRGTFFTCTTVTGPRFTSLAFGTFDTTLFCFLTNPASITRRHSTAVGKRTFYTVSAEFCPGFVLEITWVARQTIDGTNTIHVLANVAIQTGFVAGQTLVLTFATSFASH